jgi:hypothetical protein
LSVSLRFVRRSILIVKVRTRDWYYIPTQKMYSANLKLMGIITSETHLKKEFKESDLSRNRILLRKI